MNLISGTSIASEIKEECKQEVVSLREQLSKVTLAVVLVGNDKASEVYVNNKIKACLATGIVSRTIQKDETITEKELLYVIERLNRDEKVNGILVQLPLPSHIDEKKVIEAIDPRKDVDGFTNINVGRLSVGQDCLRPCTPEGIIQLLKRSNIKIEGKNCVVLGRSNIVGKPIANLLLQENGTVTICHSKTENLKEITRKADILVVAIGKPKFVTKEFVKEGAVVIDVGIHRTENGLCGDVDRESLEDMEGFITPVPGGVGPMTIAMLMKNTITAAKLQHNK